MYSRVTVFILSFILLSQPLLAEHTDTTTETRRADPSTPNEKYLALCGVPTQPTRAPGVEPTKPLDEKTLAAYDILRQNCATCHNPGSNKGAKSFSDILDVGQLLQRGIVKANDSHSLLLQRIQDGSMPLDRNELSAEEKKVLEDWIASGANSFSTSGGDIPEVGFISNSDLESCMVKDIRSQPEEDRPFIRYLNLSNLYNSSRKTELERTRLGLNKLLNSLSWKRDIKNPVVVDGTQTLLRIDLRNYRWTPELWEAIAKTNPYPEAESTKTKELAENTGTQTPALRGDWVVFAASRPPLYHTLLGLQEKQGNVGADLALERLLQVDATQDQANADMTRAGFKRSNVAKFNRVLDRHDSPYGAYWKSSDFGSSEGKQNIFENPLDFERNGGEYIFSLPNGLHGYFITNAAGVRLDAAPTNIVIDPARLDQDGAVITGQSCFECHTKGIKKKDDEILSQFLSLERLLGSRPNTEALQTEIKSVKRIYKGNERLNQQFEADERAYTEAVQKTGNTVEIPDPISATTHAFEAPLDLRAIAAELGHDVKDVEEVINSNLDLAKTFALDGAKTIDREVFNGKFRLLKGLLDRRFSPDSPQLASTTAGEVSGDREFDPNFNFVGIEPGTFKMGSDPAREPEHDIDETQHSVTITKPFEMQTTEVTQELWEKVMGSNPSRLKGKKLPVTDISWNDVQEFLKKLNKLREEQGDYNKYRLPTEAEWELSARGGTDTKYSFGDNANDLPKFARFDISAPQDVGQLTANSFKLHDMHGNVWEWVQDSYQSDLGKEAQTDPQIELGSGSVRVFRSGGWHDVARSLRSANRFGNSPGFRYDNLGFRLVRTPK